MAREGNGRRSVADYNSLSIRFERLVASLFRAEGLSVEGSSDHHDQVDLFVKSAKGPLAVVEIKLYRSRNTPIDPLFQAAALLEAARRSLKADRAILVIGGRTSPLAREMRTRSLQHVERCERVASSSST